MTVVDEIPWDPLDEPPDETDDPAPEPDWLTDYGTQNELDERTYTELTKLGAPLPDNVDHTTALKIHAGRSRLQRAQHAGHTDLDGLLNEPEPEHDWLVEGLLERGDRVILTGQEGRGKSTFLRQLAVQFAAGIHPFSLAEIPPKRVLFIDLENSRRHTRREMRPLRLSCGDRLYPGMLVIVTWPSGINLLDKEDEATFINLLADVGADILILGPSYKLAGGDPTSEEVARTVTQQLDNLREIHDLALLLEAHQPYATHGTRRAERPYGASLWSRWPEYGLHLADGGELRHWRGDREEREWPPALQRGGTWPWTSVTDLKGVTFARILEVTRDAGRKLTLRELADATGGGHPQTVDRAIKANQNQYDELIRTLEEEF